MSVNNIFQIRLKILREERGLSQKSLAEKFGLSQSTIGMWESGKREPDFDTVKALAKFFDTSVDYLLGNTNDPFFILDNKRILDDINSYENIEFETPCLSTFINVYGSVPAGVPLEAVTDIVSRIDIPIEWIKNGSEFVGLVVKGDSMEPKYIEGDTVIVKLQPDCESGQDCVVYVNGYDATLKKVIKNKDGIMLQPLNVKYEPKQYDYNDERETIKILGIVVQIRRDV